MPVPGLYMIARGCIEVHVGSKIVAMRFAGEYVGETAPKVQEAAQSMQCKKMLSLLSS